MVGCLIFKEKMNGTISRLIIPSRWTDVYLYYFECVRHEPRHQIIVLYCTCRSIDWHPDERP